MVKIAVWTLHKIYPNHEKQGYGKKLYSRMEKRFRDEGVDEVWGNVTNKDTKKFFKKLGFKFTLGGKGECYKKLNKKNVFGSGRKPKNINEIVKLDKRKLMPELFKYDTDENTDTIIVTWFKDNDLVGKSVYRIVEVKK